MKDLHRIILNALAFNVGWFACVFSSRWGEPLAAAPIIGVILTFHLLIITPSGRRRAELAAILSVAAVGTIVDSLNLTFGILGFSGSTPVFAVWIACFWLNFACTLNTSLRWLARMPVVAGVLGVISAPGTYFFGVKLGALAFHETPWVALPVLGVQWFVMLPAMSLLARRLVLIPQRTAGSERRPVQSAAAATSPEGRPES